MQTLVDLFETFAARGDKTALINRSGVRRFCYSYRELHELSLKMACLLTDRGVAPGDHVLIWGPNSSWWGVAYWGIILSGAIAVPVDFMSDRERAVTIHRLTDARLVIQSRFKLDRMAGCNELLLEELQYLLEDASPLEIAARPSPDDTAQIIYTSGTTGNPKGVMLTHRNLIANLIQINRHVPIITPAFVFLSLLPISHMFEQMGGFFTPLYRGGSIVYPGTIKPSAIMEALAEEDIHAMMAVPRLMQLLKTSIEQGLEEKRLYGFARFLLGVSLALPAALRRVVFFPVHLKFGRKFRVFVSGGAPLDPEVFQFWSGMGFTLLEGYGLTECSPVLTVNPIERQVAGSVGTPLPGIQLKLDGKEILARGDSIFPGYYRNNQATAEAFTPDGWFRTGDLGEIAPDGWLTIRGRAKELIVTGAGVNVYPDEVEAVLNKTSGVKESCVIGLERGGSEEVHAVLLLDTSGRNPADIVSDANRTLDTLQQITGFSIWDEAEFPKTATLKIQKFLVKSKLLRGRDQQGLEQSHDRLLNIIAGITGTSVSMIRDDSLMVTELGLTSIGRAELVNMLEQEFRLDLDDGLIGLETRVGDLREILAKRARVRTRDRFRFWTNSLPVRCIRRLSDILLCHPLMRCLADIEVRGSEHLQHLHQPVMFISNHLSYCDQPSIMMALPPQLRYNTATAAWEEFFFGRYDSISKRFWRRLSYDLGSWLLNLFPLPQSRSFRGALRFMGRLADHGINILFFPEGQHSRDGNLHGFQPGLGVIIRELGIPVVPVKISGTYQILPHDAGWPKPGKVTVTFGAAIRFCNESPDEIVALAHRAVEML
ncbi:MAG TPA: AMP-binding protein [Deltaproteobacteria bacterium]|nr:AMP-binding protein [Deltaproteobacteria bacterium]HQB37815.1 AMP-binding protein [Deltaproteobacteria bacterium]